MEKEKGKTTLGLVTGPILIFLGVVFLVLEFIDSPEKAGVILSPWAVLL